MNSPDEGSPMWLQGTLWSYGNSDLQPGRANPGSSESDLVSGKMKEAVIYAVIYTTVIELFKHERYKHIIF